MPPGSYLLTRERPGPRARCAAAALLARGERAGSALPLPRGGPCRRASSTCRPGRFLFGSAAEDSVREFFNAVPLHEVQTPRLPHRPPRDDVRGLDRLPGGAAARGARAPHAAPWASAFRGLLALEQVDGTWRLRSSPAPRRTSPARARRCATPGATQRARAGLAAHARDRHRLRGRGGLRGLARAHGPRARRAAVHGARVGARGARRGRARVPARRHARRRTTPTSTAPTASSPGASARTRWAATRRRAAPSAWRTWPATCGSGRAPRWSPASRWCAAAATTTRPRHRPLRQPGSSGGLAARFHPAVGLRVCATPPSRNRENLRLAGCSSHP